MCLPQPTLCGVDSVYARPRYAYGWATSPEARATATGCWGSIPLHHALAIWRELLLTSAIASVDCEHFIHASRVRHYGDPLSMVSVGNMVSRQRKMTTVTTTMIFFSQYNQVDLPFPVVHGLDSSLDFEYLPTPLFAP